MRYELSGRPSGSCNSYADVQPNSRYVSELRDLADPPARIRERAEGHSLSQHKATPPAHAKARSGLKARREGHPPWIRSEADGQPKEVD